MDTQLAIALGWSWNTSGLLCCAALLLAYAACAGLRASRALAWFLSGEALFAVAVCSPLDLFARHYLFTAEALEHVLIAFLVPYLLVRGMPETVFQRIGLSCLRVPAVLPWLIGMAALSVWFYPRFLDLAIRNEWVRGVEYATLFAGGLAFWWPLHGPLREQRLGLMPNSLWYLAAAVVWCSLLGLLVAFGPAWSNPRYTGGTDVLGISRSLVNDWSFTRENDRQTAGLLFWITAATVLLSEVMLIYYRWYTSPEIQTDSASSGRPLL